MNIASQAALVSLPHQASYMASKAAIVFLASPLASAITGVVLAVDGGWTAGEPALPL